MHRPRIFPPKQLERKLNRWENRLKETEVVENVAEGMYCMSKTCLSPACPPFPNLFLVRQHTLVSLLLPTQRFRISGLWETTQFPQKNGRKKGFPPRKKTKESGSYSPPPPPPHQIPREMAESPFSSSNVMFGCLAKAGGGGRG